MITMLDSMVFSPSYSLTVFDRLENALKARHVTTLTAPPVALVAPAPLDCLLCHECQSPRGHPGSLAHHWLHRQWLA